MRRWTLPLGRYYLRFYLGALIIFYIYDIVDLFRYGLTVVLISMALSTLLVLLAILLMKRRLGDLHEHTLSRWRMDKDLVLRRLAQTMVARGVRPKLETRENGVWFLLPPMSIVVDRKWWTTLVFVGPWTDETEQLVERLEGFVERALA
jgi:hypothetical protein